MSELEIIRENRALRLKLEEAANLAVANIE